MSHPSPLKSVGGPESRVCLSIKYEGGHLAGDGYRALLTEGEVVTGLDVPVIVCLAQV